MPEMFPVSAVQVALSVERVIKGMASSGGLG